MGKLYLPKPVQILNPKKSQSIRVPILMFAQSCILIISSAVLLTSCFKPEWHFKYTISGQGLDLNQNHVKKSLSNYEEANSFNSYLNSKVLQLSLNLFLVNRSGWVHSTEYQDLVDDGEI